MEEVILRFPHLAEQISDNLDNKSLVNCKKVSREFKDFMNFDKFYYYRIIQEYTNCSDKLMKNLVKNIESAIEVTLDLQEIFKKLPRGTRQNMRFLKSFWTTPLHEAAEMGNLTIFRLLLENSIDKIQAASGTCQNIIIWEQIKLPHFISLHLKVIFLFAKSSLKMLKIKIQQLICQN